MVDGMNPLMAKMRDATNGITDFELVKDAMPALLVQMDGFIAASPENTYLLANAAEAYMGYAFLFVEDTDKQAGKGIIFESKGICAAEPEAKQNICRSVCPG